MFSILAQTTQSSGGPATWGTGEWLAVLGFIAVTLLPAIAAFWNSVRTKSQADTNQQNIQTLAKVTDQQNVAINNSDAIKTMPPTSEAAVKSIAKDPTTPTTL